jgi:hypothetical protein
MSPDAKPSDNRTHKSTRREREHTAAAARRVTGDSLISRSIAAIYAVYALAESRRIVA